MIGDINSYAIGAAPEINGMIGSAIMNFIGVNDEAVFSLMVGRKLSGVNVLCPGDNVNQMCVRAPAEPFKPKCR